MTLRTLIIRGLTAAIVVLACFTFSKFYPFLENFFLNLIFYFVIGAFMVWAFMQGFRNVGYGILIGLFAVVGTVLVAVIIYLFKSI